MTTSTPSGVLTPLDRELRRLKALGVVADDVAAAAGIASTTLSQLRHGGKEPSLGTARRIAAAIDLPVAELFPALVDRAQRLADTLGGNFTLDPNRRQG